MHSSKMQRIAGWLIVAGTSVDFFFAIIYEVFWGGRFYSTYAFIEFLFGGWFAQLMLIGSGYLDYLAPIELLWTPPAAVVLTFLLWGGIRVLQGRIHRILLFSLIVFVLWIMFGLVFRLANGFQYGSFERLLWEILWWAIFTVIVVGAVIVIKENLNSLRITSMTEQSGSADNFKTLMGVGRFITGIGWLAFGVGVIGTLACLAKLKESWTQFMILIWVAAILFGVIIVAQGQVIRCFVSIERNTHNTSSALMSLVKRK